MNLKTRIFLHCPMEPKSLLQLYLVACPLLDRLIHNGSCKPYVLTHQRHNICEVNPDVMMLMCVDRFEIFPC